MSQQNPEAGRSIDERLLLRLPTPIVRLLFRGFALLPPGSHLRRRMLKRMFARAFEAARRDDYDVGLLFYEPDVELRSVEEVGGALGLPERYDGHQGFIDIWRDMKQDMDDFHVQPEQIVDLGDRIVLRGTLVGCGRHSGVLTRQMGGLIYYLSPRGMVARQDLYWTWDQALDALDHGEALGAADLSE